MTWDDNPSFPPDDRPDDRKDERSPADAVVGPLAPAPIAALPGDPISYAATAPEQPPSYPPRAALPEDLQISWSWIHFSVFIFFACTSFVLIQTALAVYFAPPHRLSAKEYQQYLLNKPEFLIGSNLVWFGALFLFLYVTLSVLRGVPFWGSLGWRKWNPDAGGKGPGPWVYFFSGSALAIFVVLASSQVHTKEHIPIQEVLKNRNSALLLMCMAVLVAPLVEETIFRGYLYPLFARTFGIGPGIVLTGTLFGLMHGSQLGWTWGIVLLLILVGIIFTFVRARTGTVVASFLLHLGYNSMIAAATIIGTRGFTKMPISP
jgi:membrane protease YdiL (CAAX protease family)